MSDADTTLAREIYEAWNGTTSDQWVKDYFAPDAEWHDPPELPDSGVHRGVDEIQQWLRSFVDVGGHFDLVVRESHDAGGQAVIVFTMAGRGGHSGVPVNLLVSHSVTLRDGRAWRVLAFLDRDSGFRAAGLEP
jgi:ketosteroid isomerase-like protein